MKLKCGCEAYNNMKGQIIINNFVCKIHSDNENYIREQQRLYI